MRNNNRKRFNLYTQGQRLAVRVLFILGIFFGSVPAVLAHGSLTQALIGALALSAGFQGTNALGPLEDNGLKSLRRGLKELTTWGRSVNTKRAFEAMELLDRAKDYVDHVITTASECSLLRLLCRYYPGAGNPVNVKCDFSGRVMNGDEGGKIVACLAAAQDQALINIEDPAGQAVSEWLGQEPNYKRPEELGLSFRLYLSCSQKDQPMLNFTHEALPTISLELIDLRNCGLQFPGTIEEGVLTDHLYAIGGEGCAIQGAHNIVQTKTFWGDCELSE